MHRSKRSVIGGVDIIMTTIRCHTHIPVLRLHYHEWHYSDCNMKYTSVDISFTINQTWNDTIIMWKQHFTDQCLPCTGWRGCWGFGICTTRGECVNATTSIYYTCMHTHTGQSLSSMHKEHCSHYQSNNKDKHKGQGNSNGSSSN